MKRMGAIILIFFLLTGCSETENRIDRVMALRNRLLQNGCSFRSQITADYGDKLYTFTLECAGDAKGNLTFEVAEPDTIAGISGNITGEEGFLTFDAVALQFDLLADGQVTPVSAPWLVLKTLRSGYLTSAGMDGALLRVTIDDSYAEDALQLDIWLNGEDLPVQADILYDGSRILSLEMENFQIG